MKLDDNKMRDKSEIFYNLRMNRQESQRKLDLERGSGGMHLCREIEALLDTDPLLQYKHKYGNLNPNQSALNSLSNTHETIGSE